MDDEDITIDVAMVLKSGAIVEQEMTMAEYRTAWTEIVDFWTNEESVEIYVLFGRSMVKTSEIAAISYGGAVRRETTHS